MILRQSQIKTAMECGLKLRYQMEGLPRQQSGALTWGTVLHEAVMRLEEWTLEGEQDPLTRTQSWFREAWSDPTTLDESLKIDYFLPKTSWKKYLDDGVDLIEKWWGIYQWDTDTVIAREYEFTVPVRGTDHHLTGTIDRLTLRYMGKLDDHVVLTQDYKTSRKMPTYNYLAHDLQFTAYSYASTQPEFWANIPNGEQLYQLYADKQRWGEWIHLRAPKRMDAGERSELHYNRLRYAVNAIADAVTLGVFVPNISGEACAYCFSADTEIWTAEGVRAIKDVAGSTQRVLSRRASGGAWVDAEVRSFGVQPVRELHLRRGKATRTLVTTPEHRWFVRTRKDPTRTEHITKTTRDLAPGDVLLATLPRPTTTKVDPSPIGIQAGITFGDGYLPNKRNACVTVLYQHKVSLARFFDGHPMSDRPVDGSPALSIHGLPKFLNDAPDLEESSSYLLGWLMGYVATDGSVSKDGGQVTVSSSRLDHIELVRTVAARLGIGTYDVGTYERLGYGDEPTNYYRVQLVSSTLPQGFFILDRHIARYRPRERSEERIEWTVVGVTDPERDEEVFCATVPEHENFTLEGWINTHNCDYRASCGLPSLEEEGYMDAIKTPGK